MTKIHAPDHNNDRTKFKYRHSKEKSKNKSNRNLRRKHPGNVKTEEHRKGNNGDKEKHNRKEKIIERPIESASEDKVQQQQRQRKIRSNNDGKDYKQYKLNNNIEHSLETGLRDGVKGQHKIKNTIHKGKDYYIQDKIFSNKEQHLLQGGWESNAICKGKGNRQNKGLDNKKRHSDSKSGSSVKEKHKIKNISSEKDYKQHKIRNNIDRPLEARSLDDVKQQGQIKNNIYKENDYIDNKIRDIAERPLETRTNDIKVAKDPGMTDPHFITSESSSSEYSNVNFIFVVLETTGLERESEILEITLRDAKGVRFIRYIMPSGEISKFAANVNGFYVEHDRLKHKDVQNVIPTTPLKRSLTSFLTYCKDRAPCVLVGHNIKSYACHILYYHLFKQKLLVTFTNCVTGILDTRYYIKEVYPVKLASYKLEDLCQLSNQHFNSLDSQSKTKALNHLLKRVAPLKYLNKHVVTTLDSVILYCMLRFPHT